MDLVTFTEEILNGKLHFLCSVYQASAITKKGKVSCHGNLTQNSKPYFRTPKHLLQKAREKCVNGLNAKAIYGDINSELGEYIFRLHKVVNCETRSKKRQKKRASG